LAEFVRNNYSAGDNPITFYQDLPFKRALPAGFDFIGISPPLSGVSWHSGEHGRMSLLDREHLATVIAKKNQLFAKYAANASGCPIWLLIFSGPSVSRGVPIPAAISEWRFSFDFGKVLLFSGMDNQVFELGRL
jgi:hypothetical protein